MKRPTQTSTKAAFTDLPSDLSQWLDQTSLVSLALEAVQELPWPNATVRFPEAADRSYPPQMLMTLLTYCYAVGLNEAQEIERVAGTNPVLRYLCAGDRPSWQTLMRFRRSHRPLLTQALATVLERTWEVHSALRPRLTDEPGSYLNSSLERLMQDLRHPDFTRQAGWRIDQAVLLDSIDRDD